MPVIGKNIFTCFFSLHTGSSLFDIIQILLHISPAHLAMIPGSHQPARKFHCKTVHCNSSKFCLINSHLCLTQSAERSGSFGVANR